MSLVHMAVLVIKKEISAVLDTLKDAGVTALVVDVKGSSGYTMYPSNYTREMTTRDGKTRLSDYVPFVISEAKKKRVKGVSFYGYFCGW